MLRGTCAVVDGQHSPSTGATSPPRDVPVADGIAEGAQARMRSGKRVVLRFVPDGAKFVPGYAARAPGPDDG